MPPITSVISPTAYQTFTGSRVQAARWHKQGDDAGFGQKSGRNVFGMSEGGIVRLYLNPTVAGTSKCKACGKAMSTHGWIDSGGAGQTVCPGDWIVVGSGKPRPMKPAAFKAKYRRVAARKVAPASVKKRGTALQRFAASRNITRTTRKK